MILISIGLIHFIGAPDSALSAFAIAGLGCSAFLPLTISFGEKKFFSSAPFVGPVDLYLYGWIWGFFRRHRLFT